jgi:hypothetical protein
MWRCTRRNFLKTTAAATAAATIPFRPIQASRLTAAPHGERPAQDDSVEVLNPCGRVPLSFIIDDSTCLVNMGHYCMPQFATAWPDRDIYKKPWKTWPREIPDRFVREFGEWCGEQGVKGKYSVVPNPACVGWIDRELPGWSRRELLDSLKLVRELMVPNWDIHPEMITHTRVIDLKTGRPLEEISPATMENSYPRERKSVDELTAYLAYALRILKNCGLPCEGITTPGGFGSFVKSELSLAVHGSVRDVYSADLPHYFKYVADGDQSCAPVIEHVKGLGGGDPRAVVNVPACTGDWFGGWDGDRVSEPDQYADRDAKTGRMVEVVERGEPAIMLCHWPGMYAQGTKNGFQAFRRVVTSLKARFENETQWMKVSEIGRYWAAKQLTTIERHHDTIALNAPFAAPSFTVAVAAKASHVPALAVAGQAEPLTRIDRKRDLQSGRWLSEGNHLVLCFDLAKGKTEIQLTEAAP